jgi:hypothetical protein
MVRYLILFILLLLPFSGFSQETNISNIITSIAEDLASDDSDPEAVSTFIDRLQELSENPVKINSSGESELSRLFFLSDFQVKALADYSLSTGQIYSINELATIPGFDKETVEMMIPFITLDYKFTPKSDSSRWRNSLISNLSGKPGKNDTSSLGSQWRILTKYKFTSGEFSGGITTEKDPGEKLLSGTPPLPDFLSAHLAYNGGGVIRRIIVGDFSARFGQGTNVNTGIRRGISLTSPGYMSARDEIKPYTSTDENKFFRGIAASFSLKNLEMSMFFSKNNSDATIDSLSGNSKDYIDNFYLAGIHNTASLVRKKDAISVLAYGMALSYNFNNLKTGFVWSENRLSLPLIISGNEPEKIHDFSGDRNSLYTFYYNALIRKILLYGELSANNTDKFAILQGMSFRPSDRLTIGFLYRSYNTGFTTFYGQGPGSSKSANENGVLGNFTFEAARHLFISGGYDIHHYPWLKYRCSAPSYGVRQELRLRYLPTEKLTMDASYTYRLSMTDSAETHGVPGQIKNIARNFKLSARYSFQENLTFGTRFDLSFSSPSGSRGMMLLQELSYSFKTFPVSFWARYCIFFTGDWDSRIYTYENDLLYSFYIPALYGRGSRSYIMAKWKIGDVAELRIKYGVTSSIAAGNTLVNSDEIKMQFRIWF